MFFEILDFNYLGVIEVNVEKYYPFPDIRYTDKQVILGITNFYNLGNLTYICV